MSKPLLLNQLEKAEVLLAAIQHQREGIPDVVKREVRDYFASHERGVLLNWTAMEDANVG